MKQYLTDTFRYNDYANKLALAKMFEMRKAESGTDDCIRFFSHLINSMNKWLGRIEKWGEDAPFPDPALIPPSSGPTEQGAEPNPPSYKEMDWWEPVYELDELGPKWDDCLKRWLDFIESKTEEQLAAEVEFYGFDGGDWAAVLQDIALQLNYHSIHHRAQIQYLIRQHGIEPDFVDYIGTKYRRLS